MPPEFSRPLPLCLVDPASEAGQLGRSEILEATPDERAALAHRFGILSVEALRAELLLRPDPDGAVRVTGRLLAAVTQACVVSFEPVPQLVAEPVAIRLLPAGREPSEAPDEIDEIPSEGGIADLGEAIAEQLALALDPYPRAPDAALPTELQAAATPFRSLSALRRPQ
jgi:Large ribosomal RNA subunit accumulation protein YceD